MKVHEIVGVSQPFVAKKSGKSYFHIYLTFEDADVEGIGVFDALCEYKPEFMTFNVGDQVYVFKNGNFVEGFMRV